MTHTHYVNNRILKINVGFLLSESVGQSRDTELDVPDPLKVADDLTIDGLRGVIHLSRNSRGILVQGQLATEFPSECARCLDETSVPVDLDLEELYVYPAEPGAAFVVTDDGNLDLAPLIREEAIVSVPQTALCRPDCAGLCPTCGANLNEGPCDCNKDPIDPRFAALQKLLDSPDSAESTNKRESGQRQPRARR
jgi:uncharacterized protein